MSRLALISLAAIAVGLAMVGCKRGVSGAGNAAEDLVAHVLDARAGIFGTDFEEIERRLGALYGNQSKEADEATLMLMSFYLGEHNGEELFENLLSRGPRMIPLIQRYLREAPTSLMERYPTRFRLERTTTTMLLKNALEILKVEAGARRVAKASIKTAPLRDQEGKCNVKLVERSELKFGDNLVQAGESYRGAPVLRADIEEGGSTTNVHFMQSSGIQRLDALLLVDVRKWKYAPRPNCGVIQANIVVDIDWISTN